MSRWPRRRSVRSTRQRLVSRRAKLHINGRCSRKWLLSVARHYSQVIDRSKDPCYEGDLRVMIFNVPLKTDNGQTEVGLGLSADSASTRSRNAGGRRGCGGDVGGWKAVSGVRAVASPPKPSKSRIARFTTVTRRERRKERLLQLSDEKAGYCLRKVTVVGIPVPHDKP